MLLKVVCFATKRPSGAHNMFQSLKKLHWAFDIIGRSLTWKGWLARMDAYLQYAKKQNPETIIVFVDCFDALAVREPTDFLKTFQSFDADIVVGAGSVCGGNCEPLKEYWNETKTPHHHNNKYVNAGFVTGYAGALVRMYQWCLDQKIADDQIAICRYINARPDDNVIKLDSSAQLVFNDEADCLPVAPRYELEETIITAVQGDLRATPFFIHFPGFLTKRTVFGFLRPREPLPLGNYDQVGKHVLGDEFVEIGQVDIRAYFWRNVFFWGMFSLILLLILLLALSPLYYRK